MKIKSYAKVNLNLKVYPKDETGYHKIESLITRVEDFFDVLIINKNKLDHDVINCKFKELTINNFMYSVLLILRKHLIINDYYTIILEKNIPIGSGLAGGTSNAIALAKNLIGKRKISKEIWEEIALSVGYDSYYFISAHATAFVKGYGEIVLKKEKIKIFKKDLLLTNINCSTKEVYKEFDKIGYNEEENYLTKAAISLYPTLEKYTAIGIMSGSGSTFIKKETA